MAGGSSGDHPRDVILGPSAGHSLEAVDTSSGCEQAPAAAVAGPGQPLATWPVSVAQAELARSLARECDVILGPSAGHSVAAGDTSSGCQQAPAAAMAGPAAAMAATLPANAPPVPQCHQDTAESPFDVAQDTFREKLRETNDFLQWCRTAIDRLDESLQVSAPHIQEQIRAMLVDLAGKVKEGARVQAIGEDSLEVAAPLYLVFELIIPVMCLYACHDVFFVE